MELSTDETLSQVSEAFASRKAVRLLYVQGHPGARPYWTTVNVYAIGPRYLDALQRSKRQVRTFRLDRIRRVNTLDETYEIPPGYAPSDWVTEEPGAVRARPPGQFGGDASPEQWSPLRWILVVAAYAFAAYVVLVGINSCNTGQAWVELPENRYWYCWDEGIPRPHHLGHPVPDDHFCTGDDVKDIRNYLYPPFIPDPWK